MGIENNNGCLILECDRCENEFAGAYFEEDRQELIQDAKRGFWTVENFHWICVECQKNKEEL